MQDETTIDITPDPPDERKPARRAKSLEERRACTTETLVHRQAFELYYAMGEDRTLKRVSAELNRGINTIQNWSSLFNWSDRIIARDNEIADKLALETKAEIIESKKDVLFIIRESISNMIQKDADLTRKAILEFKLKNVSDLKEAYLLMEEVRNPGSTLTKKADGGNTAQQVNIIIKK